MKYSFTIILLFPFFVLFAQDSIKFSNNFEFNIEQNPDSIKSINYSFIEKSICSLAMNKYNSHCKKMSKKLKNAESEVEKLNSRNDENGYFYELEIETNSDNYWKPIKNYCLKTPSYYYPCQISKINIVKREKSRILNDGNSSGEVLYENDLKRFPR